jgi:hypothetical protein
MSSSGESGDESAYDDIIATPVASSESGSIERLGGEELCCRKNDLSELLNHLNSKGKTV